MKNSLRLLSLLAFTSISSFAQQETFGYFDGQDEELSHCDMWEPEQVCLDSVIIEYTDSLNTIWEKGAPNKTFFHK